MADVPQVSKSKFLAAVKQRFPDADVRAKDINPAYGSWRIEIRRGDAEAHVFWGPLTGFGGTDFGRMSDDENPFQAFDMGFASSEEAEAFIARVLA